jgi:hypothetical protein
LDRISKPSRRGITAKRPAFRTWLAQVPGRTPLEQRQAWLLQFALIVLAAVFVVASISNALRGAAPGPSTGSGSANLIAGAVCLALIAALRRGWFLGVSTITVAFLVVGFGAAMAVGDATTAGPYLALLMVPIVLAGLTLPRWALLATFVGVLAVATWAARSVGPASGVPLSAVMGNFIYAALLTTAVVFAFGSALRETLSRSTQHERELELARHDIY